MDLRKIKAIDMQEALKEVLISKIKKKRYIVYGARSIQNQAPYFARNTQDWDLFAKNPKREADYLQKELDKSIGFDYFYSKPAKHKGTWKVMNKGIDMKAGNEDDENIADFSQQPSKISIITIRGMRFRNLKEEIKAKRNALKDRSQKFRHSKDSTDLERVKAFLKIKDLGGLSYGMA